MQEITDAAILRAELQKVRCSARSIGLVPTMGCLHGGHVRLISEARSANDLVVVSVFVNPTQFGPTEDLDRYPRDLPRDRAMAREHGVDVLFLPTERAMYPDGPDNQAIWVDPAQSAAYLEGASRPHHFRGVTTVVAKLFNIVQPDRAYFGQKDGQQARIVDRMSRDLSFATEVVIVPTVRESDGLALSSRNVYLSQAERQQATALSHALVLAQALIRDGQDDSALLERAITRAIQVEAPLARIDYATVSDLVTLSPMPVLNRDALVALAVWFGSTRLIDNLMVHFMDGVPQFV